MPIYITAQEVRSRLLGKVEFTDDIDNVNAMASGLLNDIIDEAEGEIETRLSVRYAIPFSPDAGGAFDGCPERPTKQQIKALCRMEAVKRVLMYDFGRGTAIAGKEYMEALNTDLEARLARLIEYREGQFGHFKYPPLPGLQLAPHNAEADDGFAGQVLVTSRLRGAYAQIQAPDPGQTFWSGEIEPIR